MRIAPPWKRRRDGLAAAFVAAAVAGPVMADDGWSILGFLSQRFQGDTNLSLDPDKNDDTLGSTTTAGLTIASENSRSSFSVSPSLTGTLFTGSNSDRNRISPSISANGSHRVAAVDLSGGVNADARPTSFSELDTSAVDPITGIPDLDLVDRNAVEISVNGNLRLGYDIDSRNRIAFGPNLRLRRFTNDGSTLSPSTTVGASGDFLHRINSSIAATAALGARHIDIGGRNGSKSLVLSADTGLQGELSPRLSLNGSVGANFSDTKSDNTGDSSTAIGLQANIRLGYQAREDLSFTFTARQSLEPGSNGELQERSILNAGLNHAINSRESFNLNLGFSRQGASSTSAVDRDTEHQLRASIGYGIALTSDLTAQVGYGFRWVPDSGREATSHNVFVSFARNFTLQP